MLELKSDLKPRQMIGLNDRTRLIVYLANYLDLINPNFLVSFFAKTSIVELMANSASATETELNLFGLEMLSFL